MNLSENAVRGEKIVSAVSAVCSAIAVLPVLSLNIISAVLGFGAARQLKSGSTLAKELSIILRIADIPVLAAALIVSYNFTGETVFKIFFIGAVLVAAFDMVIIMSLTSSDANAYFQEIYDWQQQAVQIEQIRQAKMNELAKLAEQSEPPEQTEQPVQEEIPELYERQEIPERYERKDVRERYQQIVHGEPISPMESENTIVIPDEEKIF